MGERFEGVGIFSTVGSQSRRCGRKSKSGENLATLQSEMESKELIEPLSEVIRTYPRSGGRDREGLRILRGGKIWGEGSAEPIRFPSEVGV